MTTKDNQAACVFGGLAALGALAQASSSRGPALRTFRETLREELHRQGVRLIGAELGRLRGRSLWVVACEGQDGLIYRKQIPVEYPHYERAHAVAEQVIALLGKS